MFKLIGKSHIAPMLVMLLGIVLLVAATACGGDEPAPTQEPVDVAAITAAVQEAIREASPESGPSAAEIQAMIEKAVMEAPSGASTAEIQAMIEKAVMEAPSGATAEEVKALVDAAVMEAPTGATAEEVKALVDAAVMEAPTGATAEEVKALVDAAVMEAFASSAPAKETIVFADLNWDSAQVQNAIARFIIEHGYGYPTDAIFGGTIPLQTGLLNGNIDVTMEIWLPNQQDFWDKAIAEGTVIPVGKSLDDNWQSAFVVPTYVVEANPGLKTVQDLKDHKDIFPSEGDKAILWNCISTWACAGINADQVTAYGLGDVIELKDPGSAAGLFASLEGAYQKNEPWLGYLWGPTKPAAELDLTVLEEPDCAPGAGPETGCAYPTSLIRIAVYPTLVERAPDVIEFLRKWNFSAATQIVAEGYMADTESTFSETAVWYLQNEEASWSQWVPSAVALRVKAALGN